jgi:CheY-like chemotaxis protein
MKVSRADPVNLLLVDDRPENLLALEVVLAELGENLVRADSGEEALKFVLHDDFAAILLDVRMPGISGFEARPSSSAPVSAPGTPPSSS